MPCGFLDGLNCAASRALAHALVFYLVEERQLGLAARAVVQLPDASFAVWLALLADVVYLVVWHDPAFVAVGLARALLEVLLKALDVACVAVKRTTVAALAGCLARLALIGLVVLVEAEGTGGLAHVAVQIGEEAVRITARAFVAVRVGALAAVRAALLTAVLVRVVEGSRWALRVALAEVKDVQPSKGVAAGALRWLALSARLARHCALELEGDSVIA